MRVAFGTVLLGMSTVRSATGNQLGPGWIWFELANCTLGSALVLWGWSRMRRAKAVHPALTWWEFSHAELIGACIFAILLPVWAAMPEEDRRSLFNATIEILRHVASLRGWG